MEMSGQPQTPSALTQKEPPVAIEYKDGWDPEPGTDGLEKTKIRFPGWESNHFLFPARSLCTIPPLGTRNYITVDTKTRHWNPF